MGSILTTSEFLETKAMDTADAAVMDTVPEEPMFPTMMERTGSDMSEDPVLPVTFTRQVSDAYK